MQPHESIHPTIRQAKLFLTTEPLLAKIPPDCLKISINSTKRETRSVRIESREGDLFEIQPDRPRLVSFQFGPRVVQLATVLLTPMAHFEHEAILPKAAWPGQNLGILG